MKHLRIALFAVTVYVLSLGLSGCSLPTIQDRLSHFVGTKFTNRDDPTFNSATRSYYVLVSSVNGNNFHYKKEAEGPNTRYYISAWGSSYTDCRYSLLVSPEDIILSWRNEGPKHVSKCQHN